MIFQFPNFETLRFLLTSGKVPSALSLEPAVVGTDAQGRPWVEPAGRTPRWLAAQLGEFGVLTAREAPGVGEPLDNWLQALPLTREEKLPEFGGNTPVLFELAEVAQLPEMVGEMLRLSVDRQGFRWMKGESETGGAVLLRVVGPPYYTLLRALERDQAGRGAKVRAYIEQAPRVWVEVGWSHPLVKSIVPQEGQVLLLRAPREWVFIADAPFREIYDVLDLKLPQAKLNWESVELHETLTVPLRLIEGDRQDPELWVLRDNALDQLDALVRDAKESLVQRLIFSVGEREGKTMVVLRVRPSKQPLPQLVLEAEAYAKYLKLDNLFVPSGSRVHPVLRRDAIRKLLADDPAQITWLRADSVKRGDFVPESLPDETFRPLQDWVDYVLDHDRAALTHWVQEFKFDFDPFVCPEEQGAEKAPRPGSIRRKRGEVEAEAPPARVVTRPKAPKEQRPTPDADDFAAIEILPPSQIQIELHALEQQFVAQSGSLDDPERLRLWPDMAARNAALKHTSDAGICWMNLLWELLDLDVERADLDNDTDPARKKARGERVERLDAVAASLGGEAELAWQWLRCEKVLTEKRLTTADLDRLLNSDPPPYHEVRGLVACLVWGSRDPAASRAILHRLPQLQQYLEAHEKVIGLRAVWLGWHALARLSGDPLALARARDRIVERLVSEGYSAERDLPSFLRTAGHQDSERMRVISNHVTRLRELALNWCEECKDDKGTVKQTSGHYVDLIFAFGLARLGESMRAREWLKAAEIAVAAKKPARGIADDSYEVHDFLLRAFRYRIEQVLQGRPHLGLLSAELRDQLDRSMSKGGGTANITRYCVDRMREQSQVLEPQERFNPYRDYTQKHVSELEKRLAALPDVKDGRQLLAMIQEIIKVGAGKPPAPEEMLSVLAESLMLSPRVGESFTLELLTRVEAAMDRLPAGADSSATLDNQARLLDRALFMAANYDQLLLVQSFWPRFVHVLQKSQKGNVPGREVNALFGQCLRSMRKLGLRDDIGRMIRQAEDLVRGNRSMAALQALAAKEWPKALTTLLHLAGGWLFFGDTEKAMPVLDAARELLFSREEKNNADGLFPQEYANLAVAYVTVLGQAPVELALNRITELFKKMRRLKDTFTTNRYYARLHLNIVEAVVLAVVSEDFAMGPAARKWMDDDEFLVRRRIHRDHRVMLAGS